jgi:hypothetical protein
MPGRTSVDTDRLSGLVIRPSPEIQAEWQLPTIPTQFASLQEDLRKFNGENPFGHVAFVMMKFPESNGKKVKDKVLKNIFDILRERLNKYGIRAIRADDKNYASSNRIWDNVCIYLLGSKYGIAVLENRYANEFNPNVAQEYGFMLALEGSRRVMLLKEAGFQFRADTVGTNANDFEWSRSRAKLQRSIRRAVDDWMRSLGKSSLTSLS